MNENSDVMLVRQDNVAKIKRSSVVGEKRSASYYLPIIFLIALATVIVIDVLNG